MYSGGVMKEVFIVNFFSANNFGAAMVGYALQYTLKKLNYEAIHIDCLQSPQNYTFQKFTKKFIKTTPQALYPEALKDINKDMSIVLVGSDQVLRTHVSDPYYLSWVYGYKTIISYAASFGINKFQGNIFDFIKAKKLLTRFDDKFSMIDDTHFDKKLDFIPI